MRVALLRSDDAHHVYLAHQLRSRASLVLEVIEPIAAQDRLVRRTRALHDRVLHKYHRWRRLVFGLDRYRRSYFAKPSSVETSSLGGIVVDNINGPPTRAVLRAGGYDLVVVIGTTILSPGTLEDIRAPVVNVHGGHLPEYRGNHCFFFARWKSDWNCIGSTIHFLDAGIDTGDIIEHVKPQYERWEHPEVLYCRAEMAAIHRVVELIVNRPVVSEWPRQRQTSRHRLYQTRDRLPHHDAILYLRLWACRRVEAIRRYMRVH